MMWQIGLAFLGSIFPVILFNIDRKKIIWAGFCGVLGWASYLITIKGHFGPIMASFAGAYIAGIYSEIMARKLKTPAIEFSIPGIFPLVPGINAYNTIKYLVDQNYTAAYAKGTQTIAIGGAIGFGIMLSATTFRFVKYIKSDKKE